MEYFKDLNLDDLPNEEWRDVVGYEGLYKVSNIGRVKSLCRISHPYNNRGTIIQRIVNEKIRRQHVVGGYLMVHLSKDNKKSMVKVHRIVAESFIKNSMCFTQVNHKDENKLNNNVDNL